MEGPHFQAPSCFLGSVDLGLAQIETSRLGITYQIPVAMPISHPTMRQWHSQMVFYCHGYISIILLQNDDAIG